MNYEKFCDELSSVMGLADQNPKKQLVLKKAHGAIQNFFKSEPKIKLLVQNVNADSIGTTTDLARKIRKEGEKWTDAIKRANQIIKNN